MRRVRLRAKGHIYARWKVDGRVGGVRYRKFFESREDAVACRDAMDLKLLESAKMVRLTASHLRPSELRDAEAAILRLEGRYSLQFVVDWFLRNHRETVSKKRFAEVCPLFLTDRKPHLRPTTYQDYTTTLASFGKTYGTKKLPAITGQHVLDFLKSRGVRGKSWNSLRADLNAFFAWCEKPPRQWIAHNPVKDVETFEVARRVLKPVAAHHRLTVEELLAKIGL